MCYTFYMRRKGFTLIELILVIIIIGVITTLAVPHYHKTNAIAREKTILNALEILHNANELYLARYGYYYVDTQLNGLAAINAVLGTDLVMDEDVTFVYNGIPNASVNEYTIQVTYGSITVTLDEEPLTTVPADANPHCVGPCYVIPARAT